MLKQLLLLTAVVLFGSTFAFAQAHPSNGSAHGSAAKSAASSEKNPATPTADSLAKAKKLYKMDCAMCHGDNGDGKTDVAKSMDLAMSDWTDPKTLADKTDQALFAAIRKGTDKMPAEDKSRAKDDEVQGLIAYIRSMSKQQPARAPAPASEPAPAQQSAPAPESAPVTPPTPAPGH